MAPDEVVLGMVLAGVVLYALLGGADFGAGVWQALAGDRAPPEEREQIHAAVGPVWEANHVWLIFVVVLLYTAFPPAFAALARALWVPLLAGLAGIVARGAAFAFRPRDPAARGERRAFERVFALASVAAPFFLGACVGAVAGGGLPVGRDGDFHGSVLSWVSPLSLYVGVLAVAACAHLAAVYLARESALAGRAALGATWRRRAVASGLVLAAASLAGIGVVAATAPALWTGFRDHAPWLAALSAAGGFASIALVRVRRPTGAAVAAALSVAVVLVGAWAAQRPFLVPPAITMETARAPRAVLEAVAASVAVGAALVGPSMWILLRTFKSARAVRAGAPRDAGR